MKFMMWLPLFLFLSFNQNSASAAVDLSQLDSTIPQQLMQIRVVSIDVDPGPPLAAVQPTAVIRFQYKACRDLPFKAQVQVKNDILFVALETGIHTMECRGPFMVHEDSLQISSDFRERVVVLNPLLTTSVRN